MLQFVRIIRTWSKIHKVLVIIQLYVVKQSYLSNDDIDTLIHMLTTYNHIAHVKTFCVVRSNRDFGYFLQVLCLMRDSENLTLPLCFDKSMRFSHVQKTSHLYEGANLAEKNGPSTRDLHKFQDHFCCWNCKNSIWYQMISFVYSCLTSCFMSRIIKLKNPRKARRTSFPFFFTYEQTGVDAHNFSENLSC